MTGPPYPWPNPVPGSNAIGTFAIGISPVGSIVPFQYWSTIISQYANSNIITTLIGNFDQYLDQTQNLDAFFDNIWNVNTAQGYGLDTWGNIVNISRVLTVANPGFSFGFEEAVQPGGVIGTFGQGAFYSGAGITSSFTLSDTSYRLLIFAKALTNICDGSTPAINQILLSLFPGRGPCYVTDGQNMTMTYTFRFGLTSVELAIVESSGVLPKPVGVLATVVQV